MRAAQQLSEYLPGPRSLPDYIIVGEKRCGTTSLHRYLLQHPQIRSPLTAKSTHFFDINFDKGLDWYRSFFVPDHISWTGKAPRARRRHEPTKTIVGETSPYYLFHPLAAERIARLLPDVKLIVMLREPGIRAWSHFRYETAKGNEHLSFEEAIATESARLAGAEQGLIDNPHSVNDAHRAFSYVARGRYAQTLRRLHVAVGDPSRVHVVTSEDLFMKPHQSLNAVHEFLEIDGYKTPLLTPGRQNIPSEAPPVDLRSVRELLTLDQAQLAKLLDREVWQ